MVYGHEIPTTISGLMNKCTFPVEAPLYAAKQPDAISDGDIIPFSVPDKNAKGLTRITIATMVEYVDKTIPFRILRDDDIVEVYEYLATYHKELAKFRGVADADDYMPKVDRLLKMLVPSIRILSSRNTRAAKLHNDGKLDAALKRFSGLDKE